MAENIKKTDAVSIRTSELLDCPFCGKDAEIDDAYDEYEGVQYWEVCCNNCWAVTCRKLTKEEAALFWNQRAI